MAAWNELTNGEEDKVWKRFEKQFCFRPSVHPKHWPGIVEPEDSVTYSIGHVYGDEDQYTLLTNDLSVKLIKAFRECVPGGKSIWVLDWQHPCYRFYPHDDFQFHDEDDWPVPALPNGDYYIFLSPDLEFGVFGHPWEQSMCVFGEPLLEAFDRDLPELFSAKIRIGGVAL